MTRVLLMVMAAFFASINAFSQNVGIGTNNPQSKLQVEGAISSTPKTGAAGATITIPANVSVFRITDDGASAANLITVSTPNEGQYLTIYNTDAQPATLNSISIAAVNGVAQFQYINAGWRLVSDNSTNGNVFIKNQSTPQSGADFNISGNGTIGGNATISSLGGAGNRYVKVDNTGKLSAQSGVAAGDLTGTVAVGNLPLLSGDVTGSITANSITNNAITSAKIQDGTVNAADLAQMGAGVGQVLKWNGSGWAPASDNSNNGTVTDVAASNGLNSTGGTTPTIKLGGTLTATTDVALNGKKLTFSGSGAVGIGTTNPAQGRLWVQDGDIWITGNNSKLAFNTDNTTDPTPTASIIAAANGLSGASADLMFNTWNGSADVEIMRVRSNGNVGIGITTPTYLLHVGATNDATTDTKSIMVESNGYAGLILNGDRSNAGGEPGGAFITLQQDAAGVKGIIGMINTNGKDGSGNTFTGSVGNSMLVANKYNGALQLGTNNTVRMSIAGGGAVTVNNLAGTGNRLIYAASNGTLEAPPTKYADGILYGSINIGDFGGSCKILSSPTGVVSSATCRSASSNDEAITIYISPSISSYTPFITAVSNSPGTVTSTGSQWNNDNDQIFSVGNITSSSFDVYLREVSGNTQNIRLEIMLMVKSF